MRPGLLKLVRPALKDAGRVGIVGASGSGKSSLLREVCREIPGRLLAYDPRGSLRLPVVYSLRSFWSAFGDRSAHLSMTDASLFRSLFPWLAEYGRVLLVVDEAQEVFPREKPAPSALRLITQGRHVGLGLIWATQRPTRVWTDLTGNSQALAIGRLLAPADMVYARGWGLRSAMRCFEFTVIPSDSNLYTLTSCP